MIAQNETMEYQLQCLEQQVELKLPIIFCLNYFVSFMAFVLESPLSVFTKRRQTLNVSKLFLSRLKILLLIIGMYVHIYLELR